ncbi:MAG: hypothetical protein K6U04_08730 [Armatimonadetes bacterium]|nr:hypothetical protein [Armatimonadota bacterium]
MDKFKVGDKVIFRDGDLRIAGIVYAVDGDHALIEISWEDAIWVKIADLMLMRPAKNEAA